MTDATLVQFDDPPRGAPLAAQNATERIAATLRNAGIDAPNSLYDEALAFAREGHLGQAVSRLQMLTCLDPDDADALLLMAKVHAAQGRPGEALARLDAAVAAGGLAPAGFREQLEGAIRVERAREEEHRSRIAAREQGEIRSLRNETRTLRSETVRLETEMAQSRDRERTWKYATLGVSVVGILAMTVLAFTGGGGTPAAAPAVAAAEMAAPAAEVAAAEASPGSVPTARVERPPAAVNAPTAGAGAGVAVPVAVAPVPVAPAPVAPAPVAAAKVPAAAAAAPVAPEKKSDAAPEKKSDAGPRVHVVGKGDTLYKLANRYYGDSSRWKEIEAANKSVLGKSIDLSLGMKLRIP